jgi:CHAT domain-containing protein
MRYPLLLLFTFFGFNLNAQKTFPPVAGKVDSLLNAAYNFSESKDTVKTESEVKKVQEYLSSLGLDYKTYSGVINLFLSYYTFNPELRKSYKADAIRQLKGSGKTLPDAFSLAMYNVMQLHYNAGRMKEWLAVDSVYKQQISTTSNADSLRYVLIEYADRKITQKEYATGKQLALYDYYIFMYRNSSLAFDKLSLMYADWLVFKADFDHWLDLPFDFRYPEEFSKQSISAYTYKRVFTPEEYEIRDKNYKTIFVELIARLKELKKEMILENGYDKQSFNKPVRRGYYKVYLSIIRSFYLWALTENKEGQVILPLKQFINQDLIPNEFEPANKYNVTPVISGDEYLELVRSLVNLYHLVANGANANETIFSSLDYFLVKKIFTDEEQNRALIALTKDRVKAERLRSDYTQSAKASQTSKQLSKKPDTVTQANLYRWDNYMDARAQEIYTLLENKQENDAVDSLGKLLDQVNPLDNGTEEAQIYKMKSWPDLQYLMAIVNAKKGKWMTTLLKECLSDIEKISPLPDIYYPVQLLYLKSVFRTEKKVANDVLSNLLVYTGRQLRFTFMMLSAEERMVLYEKKLSPFFDVYHELLFRGYLDSSTALKQKVIAQSLSLKNSLADGNLIPNEVFLKKNASTQEKSLEILRELRQEVNMSFQKAKMVSAFAPESGKLKDRVQDMWLDLLDKSGMDSLVQLVDWKKISSILKPGQVYTEFVRYNRWLDDSSAHYGAYVILPGGKIKVHDLYDENKLIGLLKDPKSSPQTASIKTNGNRGGQVTNTVTEPAGEFKQGSIDQLGKLLVQPLWTYVSNQKEWFLVQDGLLNRISMASLQWKYKNLVDYIQLNQLSGSRTLFQSPISLSKTSKILLAGGLDYGTSFSKNTNRLFQSAYSWNYLPGTSKEIQMLNPLFKSKGLTTTTITGKNFPDSLISILPEYNVVHLSTHGFYFDSSAADKIYAAKWNRQSLKDEPLFRSGIVMSLANAPDTSSDKVEGYFLGYELANTDLRKCYLVSLSACETGLGDLRNNLGVDGLSRALKIGGARHLLISLWKVPDQPTAVFMQQFYTQLLSGKTPAQALRSTQVLMAKKFKAKDWAAFVLVE